jgi:hypothetical protein
MDNVLYGWQDISSYSTIYSYDAVNNGKSTRLKFNQKNPYSGWDDYAIPFFYQLDITKNEFGNLPLEDQIDMVLKLHRYYGVPENHIDLWISYVKEKLKLSVKWTLYTGNVHADY